MSTMISEIQFDSESGDMIVPLPQEIIDLWQLKPGDDISWSIDGDSIIIHKTSEEPIDENI